jgi:hypothetical protein
MTKQPKMPITEAVDDLMFAADVNTDLIEVTSSSCLPIAVRKTISSPVHMIVCTHQHACVGFSVWSVSIDRVYIGTPVHCLVNYPIIDPQASTS